MNYRIKIHDCVKKKIVPRFEFAKCIICSRFVDLVFIGRRFTVSSLDYGKNQLSVVIFALSNYTSIEIIDSLNRTVYTEDERLQLTLFKCVCFASTSKWKPFLGLIFA